VVGPVVGVGLPVFIEGKACSLGAEGFFIMAPAAGLVAIFRATAAMAGVVLGLGGALDGVGSVLGSVLLGPAGGFF